MKPNPNEWTAVDVSNYPESCAVTDACGRWRDKSTGDIFVVLFQDVQHGTLHGYRVWKDPLPTDVPVQMWHISTVSRLVSLYEPESASPSTACERCGGTGWKPWGRAGHVACECIDRSSPSTAGQAATPAQKQQTTTPTSEED